MFQENQYGPLFPKASEVTCHSSAATDHSNPQIDLMALGKTLVKVEALGEFIKRYPNKADAKLLVDGFKFGFKLQYSGPRDFSDAKNLKSAYSNKLALQEKLDKEVNLGRISGPHPNPPFCNLRISPKGVVPKADGSWRLITHLSYPSGRSINDGINYDLCSVNYTSFDTVADMIFKQGRSALLAKRDIKSAFRLLPVNPTDFHLLGMKVDNMYYFDKCLPMGLSLSCALWEKVSTFLHWLVTEVTGLETLDHYLDDFIFVGKSGSDNCLTLVKAFEDICLQLGIPIAEEKSVGPVSVLTFLGFELDSDQMTIRIPFSKIQELLDLIRNFLCRSKVTLKQLQSLTGKLCFFSKAICGSRAFLRRFYEAMSGLDKPHHHRRVTTDIVDDLRVWVSFLNNFNGVVHIPANVWHDSNVLNLHTDSAGAADCGGACYLDGCWAFFPWPLSWSKSQILKDMTFLEMVPVVLAIALWGSRIANKKVLMWIDNEALVKVLNKQSCRSKAVMHLVRYFVLKSMSSNIVFKAKHIASKANGICDSLSRKQWSRFRELAPKANNDPEVIPQDFLLLISTVKLQDF
ncbi:uncharacterized protein LOC128556673 [Mercenaria mercenaria]|uniref:uncharacterized protein LOC128556673 n=1 Tax=Mercenaria mercenaria TaxID=6596 RepID=UPI00234F1CD6|nr:uncharacterized protein LOC128556673 [Mercenaria mercenaria]